MPAATTALTVLKQHKRTVSLPSRDCFFGDEFYTRTLLSAIVVDRANETADCWTVDIQIRPEPMTECMVDKLGPKLRLVVILCSSMKTLFSLTDCSLTLTVSIGSTVFRVIFIKKSTIGTN